MKTSPSAVVLLAAAALLVPAGAAQARAGEPGTMEIRKVSRVVHYTLHELRPDVGRQVDSGLISITYVCHPNATTLGAFLGASVRTPTVVVSEDRLLTYLPCDGERHTTVVEVSRGTGLPWAPASRRERGTATIQYGVEDADPETLLTDRRVRVRYHGW